MGSSKAKPFSKKQYRPWDKLLEESVSENTPFEDTFEDDEPTAEMELIENNTTPQSNDSRPHESATTPCLDTEPSNLISHYDNLSEEHLTQVNQQLSTFIEEKELQKEDLLAQINDKSESPMLFGGFFDPRGVCVQQTSSHGRQISRLLHDLRSREEELLNLNNNLKVVQALKQAEQSESERRHEHQMRLAAEDQMKKTLEKAQAATHELQRAINQTKLAEAAQKQEEAARRQAEKQAEQERISARNALLRTEAAEQAKIEAEEIAEQKISFAEQTEKQFEQLNLDKHRLERELSGMQSRVEELDSLRLAAESEKESTESAMQEVLTKLSDVEKSAAAKLISEVEALGAAHEAEKSELTASITAGFEQEIASLKSEYQRTLEERNHFEAALQEQLETLDKTQVELQESQTLTEQLRAIIQTEQDLRRQAESQCKQISEQAELKLKSAEKQTAHELEQAKRQVADAENARIQAENKAKMVDERAKRAIAHANQTVMKFLDSPMDDEITNSES